MKSVLPKMVVRLPIIVGMCLGLFLSSTQIVPAAEKLDLNTATEAELAKIDGISPELAKLIVKHREGVGHFASLLELLPLFNEAKLLHLEKQLKISPPTEQQKIRRGMVFGEG